MSDEEEYLGGKVTMSSDVPEGLATEFCEGFVNGFKENPLIKAIQDKRIEELNQIFLQDALDPEDQHTVSEWRGDAD